MVKIGNLCRIIDAECDKTNYFIFIEELQLVVVVDLYKN